MVVECWHDLDNTEYDCWPITDPNDYNMISCGGEYNLFRLQCTHFVLTLDYSELSRGLLLFCFSGF